MNAYMGCCCQEVPCGEVPCPTNGGLFICGTYTITVAAEQSYHSLADPCCGQGVGKEEDSRNSDAYRRITVSFKTILRNLFGGDKYSSSGQDGVGTYTKYSIRVLGSASETEINYSDNSNNCPNEPPPTFVSRRTLNNEINISEQEDPIGSSLNISLNTYLFDCSESNNFLQDNCLYEYYSLETCLQQLEIKFDVRQLAEVALSETYYVFQFGQVQADDGFSSSEEYVWYSPEISSSFFRRLSSNSGCAQTEENPNFEVHVVMPNCAPIDYDTDRCNCEQYGLPCNSFNSYDVSKPLASYGVSLSHPSGEIGSFADVVPCSMNTFGMANSEQKYNSYSFYRDCFAVGTCNEVPDSLPSKEQTINETKQVELEYSLEIHKWQYIQEADMPPDTEDWDDGLSCV